MDKNKGKMKSKNKMIFVCLAAVVVIAAVVVVLIVTNNKKSGTENETTKSAASELKLDENQGAYQEEETEPVQSRNIVMPGWTTLNIAADTTDIQRGIDFFNPEDNEGYYYMTFELFVDLAGNGEYESIYKSGLVEPGNHIQKITLTKALPAGTYDAYVFIQPYRINDLEEPLNSGNVQLSLVVG